MGWGKGASSWGKGASSWGKGGGKGKGGNKGLSVDPARKVWIGGLGEVNWKDLQTHMNQAGKTTWIATFSGKNAGTGAAVYATAAEASAAAAMLNGTAINGVTVITCDSWEKK